MLFNSLTFLVFLPVVLLVYYRLRIRAQNVWLLLASYFFYGYWDYRFLLLIVISTLTDYIVGLRMHASSSPRRRKQLLLLSLCVNLGILGFFKYFGFFVSSAETLLTNLGVHANVPLLQIVLPVGISFYTFQTLSYTIDIYRRQLAPTRNLVDFALFVAYFPQLVAGPIERARNLLPKLQAVRRISWPAIAVGVELIIIGYAKKVGIADSLAPLIDTRFSNPALASGSSLLLTAYLFSIQIYCDFSGYSDIARGVSKLFGIELMRNFEQPYFSRNITQFWQRWHISLSTWLRDYLYIPLGGSRAGMYKTYRNLFMTMLLGGLWHGASWNFVAWGCLHGCYLALHRMFRGNHQSEKSMTGATLISIFVTFNVVTLTWILFRSSDFMSAYQYFIGIVSWQAGSEVMQELHWNSVKVMVAFAILMVLDLAQSRSGQHAAFLNVHWLPRGAIYAVLIIVTLAMGGIGQNVPFIYFQF